MCSFRIKAPNSVPAPSLEQCFGVTDSGHCSAFITRAISSQPQIIWCMSLVERDHDRFNIAEDPLNLRLLERQILNMKPYLDPEEPTFLRAFIRKSS